MNNRDFSNLGEEIWRTVEDAMNSMDYGQLNQRINQTVNMAMDEARKQFGRYNYNKPPHVTPPPTPHVTPDMVKNTRASKKNRIQIKPVGKIAGILLTILGGIGTLAMIPLTVPFGILAFAETTMAGKVAGLTVFLISFMVLLVCAFCLVKGSFMWNRYRIFKKYLAVLDGRDFCTIEELCKKTGQSAKKVRKKLKEINTIPLWKSQMVLAIGVENSSRAAKAQREVTDMTNELLKKNAEKLKLATIDTAKEAERGIVDIETLKATNESLISTLDEVMKIQTEGREKRRAAELELNRIEGELKQKLLQM